MANLNQDARARRLAAALREKEEALARRRADRAAGPSLRQVQNVAAASLMAAAAAWMTGFPTELLAGLGLVGTALAALADLQPMFFGIAVGCLAAGFGHLRARRARTGARVSPQPAALMLWLTVLFLALNLAPALL